MTLLPLAHPMRDALTAYGINPLRTPEAVEMTETQHGIIIDQYLTDDTGELVFHEGDRGVGVEPVSVKRFFPHPVTGTE